MLSIIIQITLYYSNYKLYRSIYADYLNTSVSHKDYLKTIFKDIDHKDLLLNFSSKWFDWLKWMLIIGSISLVESKIHDIYLTAIIYVSYGALLLNLYICLYKFTLISYLCSFDAIVNTLHALKIDEFKDFNKLECNSQLVSIKRTVNGMAIIESLILTSFSAQLIMHIISNLSIHI